MNERYSDGHTETTFRTMSEIAEKEGAVVWLGEAVSNGVRVWRP